MKKGIVRCVVICLVVAFGWMENGAVAAEEAALDALRIPDKALRAALEEMAGRSPLSGVDLRALGGRIDLSGRGIRDCAGLEYLVNVTAIDLSNNQIRAFDQRYVHGLPKDIDLSGNANLTEIADTAFAGSLSIRSLILPTETQAIGKEAFMNATALQRIEAPGVATIDRFAFYGARALDQATLPGVVAVGDAAFGDCAGLTGLSLPNAETIGASGFARCDALRAIELPQVVSIGAFGFQGCAALSSLKLPAVRTIGVSAFAECDALERVDFSYPDALVQVGRRAFPDQNMRIRFIEDEVEAPATRVPNVSPTLAAAAGEPNWQLYTVSDEARAHFSPDTRNLQLEMLGPTNAQEGEPVSLVVPTNGFLRYEFRFELWPSGSAIEKRNASHSDTLPETWKEEPLPSSSVPKTGRDDAFAPIDDVIIVGGLGVLVCFVLAALLWQIRSRL